MTRCYIVKLRDVKTISAKAVKVWDYSGGVEILPISQMLHKGGNEYWVAEFVLRGKNLAYSYKNTSWVDLCSGKVSPMVKIEEYVPDKIEVKGVRDVDELHR